MVVATALKGWLPYVFQGLNVWMSDQDIQAGTQWGIELKENLRSEFGILCLTPENLKSQWLTFEAGALSQAIETSRVAPYRFQMSASDVGPPLSQFQGVDADEQGTLKLVRSINDALNRPLSDDATIQAVFKKWWPDLNETLTGIPLKPVGEIRSDRNILEEVLQTVRRAGIRDLNSSLGRILVLPNVLKVEVAPKVVAGEVKNRIALRITVKKKLRLEEIPPDELIPSELFGLETDVVQMVEEG